MTHGLQEFYDSSRVAEEVDEGVLSRWFSATAIPDRGGEVGDYLDGLFQNVIPHAIRTHLPQFAGHMTSALPQFVEPLGRIVTVLNQNVVKLETSGSLTFLERQALAMLHRLLYERSDAFYAEHAQNTNSTLGMVTSGGTVGNISALWCARNKRFGPRPGFAGIDHEGLPAALEAYGFRRAVILGSDLMHYSLQKAADILGIGSSALLRIAVGHDGAVDVDAMRRRIDECARNRECVLALVGVAGATETGAVDSLPALADLAEASGSHFHVDAAWAGPVLLSREHRSVLAGIERADTVVIDGHKQLYLPIGIGTVLFRDPHTAAAIEKSAQYTLREGSPDLGRRSFEGSRPARALHLHAALHILGRRGYEQLIDNGVGKTRRLAERIKRRPEFELLEEPRLNIIVYRYVPQRFRDLLRQGGLLADEHAEQVNRLNNLIQVRQFRAGRTFASRTSLRHTRHGSAIPVACFRLVLSNPLTRTEDIDAVLADQVHLGHELEVELGLLPATTAATATATAAAATVYE